MQPFPILDEVSCDLSMDFIDGLLSFASKSTILVVVDHFSEAVHFIALAHPFIVKHVTEAFIEHVFKLHRRPKSIVYDRDAVFTSKFWQEFFKLQGVEHQMSSTYHP